MNHTSQSPSLGNNIKTAFLAVFTYLKTAYNSGSLPPIKKLADSRLGQALNHGRAGRIWTIIKKWIEFFLRHLRETSLKSKIGDLKTIITFWKRGWLGRAELFTLVMGGLLVPTVVILPPGSADQLSLPVLTAGLVLFSLAYAFAYAAISQIAFVYFTLFGSFLLWYAIIIGVGLRGTPLFALPALWFLLTAWWVARSESGRQKYIYLAAACLVVSYLTYGAFGIYAHFKNSLPEWVMLVGLGTVYYAVLLGLLARYKKAPLPLRPKPLVMFVGSLLVLVLFFSLAGFKDVNQLSLYALLSARGLLGVADIFWMWLGASMVEGTLKWGDWWTEESVGLLTKKAMRWLIPAAWFLTALLGWLATLTSASAEITWFVYNIGLQNWVNTWEDSVYFSMQIQVYVSLAALLLWGGVLLVRRASDRFLGILSGVWIAAFLTLIGFYKKFQQLGSLNVDAVTPNDWWLALVLVVGLVWELAKAGENYWKTESTGRHLMVMALLGFMFSISAMTLGAGKSEVMAEYSFYSFNGVIYLGIPLMIYLVVKKFGYISPGRNRLMGLVAIGALTAVAPLSINPEGDWSLWLAPIIWGLLLAVWAVPLARFENRVDALVAGGALATGFSTYWMSPEPVPVLFFSFLQQLQDRYLYVNQTRPFLQFENLFFILACLVVGIMVGWLVYALRWRLLGAKAVNE